LSLADVQGALATPMPGRIAPMLANLIKQPFNDPLWLFEPKLDGYRVIARLQNGRATLTSRNGLDISTKFPSIKASIQSQKTAQIILDGELVALDESGRPCFQCLQDYTSPYRSRSENTGGSFVLIYYVFDILYLDGYDLRNLPLRQRKKILAGAVVLSPHLKLVEYFENDGLSLFEVAIAHGLEGVMAKRLDSLYIDGKRSPDWLKVKKVESDEFVIVGYTGGSGNRAATFGALLLAAYNSHGRLEYSGSVGTGLDDRTLSDLSSRLKDIRTSDSSLSVVPELPSDVSWVRPLWIAEVKYTEKTRDGLLRAPVFVRLRDDQSLPPEVSENSLEVKDMSASEVSAGNSAVKYVLTQLQNNVDSFILQVEGSELSLSNLEKTLWPGVTKRQLLQYLCLVSPFMLPHLKDRPITLTRYPSGIQGKHFYQRHSDLARPDFVQTVSLTEHEMGRRDFLLCNNLATLLWLGQLAVVDIHSWFSRISPGISDPDRTATEMVDPDIIVGYPDFLIFDIDPYIYSGNEAVGDEPELNQKGFKATAQTALWLKSVLDSLGLPAFLKTSGMTGLHVFVPVVRRVEYTGTHSAAKTIAGYLLNKHPAEVTMEWQTARRQGKVFLDYNQNARSKTLAAVYSPRHAFQATTSTPLRWEELKTVYPTQFTILTLPQRLEQTGDLWSGILAHPVDIEKVVN
jgi:bifunctional non-homologous end joining protein LigD